jgi:hypothetical protein
VIATRNVWGATKEAGAISLYVVDAMHTILLVFHGFWLIQGDHYSVKLLSRISDVLNVVLDSAHPLARTTPEKPDGRFVLSGISVESDNLQDTARQLYQ